MFRSWRPLSQLASNTHLSPRLCASRHTKLQYPPLMVTSLCFCVWVFSGASGKDCSSLRSLALFSAFGRNISRAPWRSWSFELYSATSFSDFSTTWAKGVPFGHCRKPSDSGSTLPGLAAGIQVESCQGRTCYKFLQREKKPETMRCRLSAPQKWTQILG